MFYHVQSYLSHAIKLIRNTINVRFYFPKSVHATANAVHRVFRRRAWPLSKHSSRPRQHSLGALPRLVILHTLIHPPPMHTHMYSSIPTHWCRRAQGVWEKYLSVQAQAACSFGSVSILETHEYSWLLVIYSPPSNRTCNTLV
jgi:hypothetical protein